MAPRFGVFFVFSARLSAETESKRGSGVTRLRAGVACRRWVSHRPLRGSASGRSPLHHAVHHDTGRVEVAGQRAGRCGATTCPWLRRRGACTRWRLLGALNTARASHGHTDEGRSPHEHDPVPRGNEHARRWRCPYRLRWHPHSEPLEAAPMSRGPHNIPVLTIIAAVSGDRDTPIAGFMSNVQDIIVELLLKSSRTSPCRAQRRRSPWSMNPRPARTGHGTRSPLARRPRHRPPPRNVVSFACH